MRLWESRGGQSDMTEKEHYNLWSDLLAYSIKPEDIQDLSDDCETLGLSLITAMKRTLWSCEAALYNKESPTPLPYRKSYRTLSKKYSEQQLLFIINWLKEAIKMYPRVKKQTVINCLKWIGGILID